MKPSQRRAVALLAGALAPPLFASAAQALAAHPASPGAYPSPAGSTGWRLNTVISVPHRLVVLVSVDAVSAADAWAAGTGVRRLRHGAQAAARTLERQVVAPGSPAR